jgi:hypothetical protein
MKKVCIFCKKDMGEIEGGKEEDTTHGICPDCEGEELKKISQERETLKQIHESFRKR